MTDVVLESVKFDLGCGFNKQPGFTGVDLYGEPDVRFDLMTTPWTFAADNSVDELWCSHFFEHLSGPQRIAFMDECWRVLRGGTLDTHGNVETPGGKLTIICPYYTSMRASQDPTHVWPPISEATFLYFNKGWRAMNKLEHYLGTCDFDFSYGYMLYPDWQARNQETRDFAIKHYNNVVSDIQVALTKRGA